MFPRSKGWPTARSGSEFAALVRAVASYADMGVQFCRDEAIAGDSTPIHRVIDDIVAAVRQAGSSTGNISEFQWLEALTTWKLYGTPALYVQSDDRMIEDDDASEASEKGEEP